MLLCFSVLFSQPVSAAPEGTKNSYCGFKYSANTLKSILFIHCTPNMQNTSIQDLLYSQNV